MNPRKYIPPMSILLFIALTAVSAYFVRRTILRRAMVTAMQMDDVGTMRSLLDWWPAPVNARQEGGGTPLRWAADHNDLVTATMLLDKGAKVDAFGRPVCLEWSGPMAVESGVQFFQDATPLHVAVCRRHFDLARLLVRRGADVNLATRGRSQCRYESDVPEASLTPVELACSAGDPGLLDVLIRSGARVPQRDGTFHWQLAVHGGRADVLRVLLGHGADPNTRDHFGNTPFHYARMMGRDDLMALLRAYGATE